MVTPPRRRRAAAHPPSSPARLGPDAPWPACFTPWPGEEDELGAQSWFGVPTNRAFLAWRSLPAGKAAPWVALECCIRTVLGIRSYTSYAQAACEQVWDDASLRLPATDADLARIGQLIGATTVAASPVAWIPAATSWAESAFQTLAPRLVYLWKQARRRSLTRRREPVSETPSSASRPPDLSSRPPDLSSRPAVLPSPPAVPSLSPAVLPSPPAVPSLSPAVPSSLFASPGTPFPPDASGARHPLPPSPGSPPPAADMSHGRLDSPRATKRRMLGSGSPLSLAPPALGMSPAPSLVPSAGPRLLVTRRLIVVLDRATAEQAAAPHSAQLAISELLNDDCVARRASAEIRADHLSWVRFLDQLRSIHPVYTIGRLHLGYNAARAGEAVQWVSIHDEVAFRLAIGTLHWYAQYGHAPPYLRFALAPHTQ